MRYVEEERQKLAPPIGIRLSYSLLDTLKKEAATRVPSDKRGAGTAQSDVVRDALLAFFKSKHRRLYAKDGAEEALIKAVRSGMSASLVADLLELAVGARNQAFGQVVADLAELSRATVGRRRQQRRRNDGKNT